MSTKNVRKINSNKNFESEVKPAVAKSAKATPRREAKASRSEGMSESQKRAKLLKERFCPEGLAWLRENLGIDLSSSRVPLQAVYDIAGGLVTSSPIEAVVKPLAYDKVRKETVQMPPIKVVGSFRIVMPYDRKTFSPVPPSKEQPVFVASYPCFDLLQKGDPAEAAAKAPVRSASEDEMPKFTPEMVMALEGVGIREDRLYKGSFNAVPFSEKKAMAAGEAFDCTGTVRIADGFDDRLAVNVNGRARLDIAKDGSVKARFEPQYPVEQRAGQVVDLIRASRMGNLEIDIYERDSSGRMKTDVYNAPIINKAGRDLVKYGRAFGLMDGYTHTKTYSGGKFEENIQKDKYEVSVINGGLCVTRAKRVEELDQDGNAVTTVIGGKEVPKFHYESSLAKVNSDGTVRVGTQDLKPATQADLESYKRGVGGRFVGYETTDFKTKKKVVYDAYVVPDNRRNGYGRAYSQKVSEELFARRAEKKAARKQNFAMGL